MSAQITIPPREIGLHLDYSQQPTFLKMIVSKPVKSTLHEHKLLLSLQKLCLLLSSSDSSSAEFKVKRCEIKMETKQLIF